MAKKVKKLVDGEAGKKTLTYALIGRLAWKPFGMEDETLSEILVLLWHFKNISNAVG